MESYINMSFKFGIFCNYVLFHLNIMHISTKYSGIALWHSPLKSYVSSPAWAKLCRHHILACGWRVWPLMAHLAHLLSARPDLERERPTKQGMGKRKTQILSEHLQEAGGMDWGPKKWERIWTNGRFKPPPHPTPALEERLVPGPELAAFGQPWPCCSLWRGDLANQPPLAYLMKSLATRLQGQHHWTWRHRWISLPLSSVLEELQHDHLPFHDQCNWYYWGLYVVRYWLLLHSLGRHPRHFLCSLCSTRLITSKGKTINYIMSKWFKLKCYWFSKSFYCTIHKQTHLTWKARSFWL